MIKSGISLFRKKVNAGITPDRRINARMHVELPLKVNGDIAGETINISDEGICFVVAQPISLKDIKITVGPLEGEFQPVWRDEKIDQHRFRYGGVFKVLNA